MNAVTKLRIGFITIAVSTLAVAALASFALREFTRANDELSGRALPLLVSLDDLSLISFDLAGEAPQLLAHLQNGGAEPFLDLMETNAKALEESFQSVIDQNAAPKLADIRSLVQLVQNSVLQLRTAEIARKDLFGAYQGDITAVQTDAAALLSLIEDLKTAASLRIEQDGASPQALSLLRKTGEAQNIAQGIISGYDALDLTTHQSEILKEKRLIELHFSNLFQVLSRITDPGARSSLSKTALGLFEAEYYEGAFATREEYLSLGNQQNQSVAQLVNAVQRIKYVVSEEARRQRDLVLELENTLTRKARYTSFVVIALALVVAAACAGILYFVVEKQILQRLRMVSQNATRVASGDLTQMPAFKHRDEIGALGQAVDELRRLYLHLRQLQSELQLAKNEAEASANAKADFLAMMSHEVRTPLNAIMGIFDLIERADIPERQKLRARNGSMAAEGLFELLSKVLDASRLEADSLQITPSDVNTEELVNYLRFSLDGAIALSRKPLEMNIDVSENLPETLFTDGPRLRQILTNLIDNAVRFSDAGEIDIALRQVQDPTGPQFEVTVQDTGVGIAPANMDLIFESFRQVEGGPTRRMGGSGLGLAISRKLAKLLGGDLTVHSTLNMGSTFTLRISMPT